MLTTPQDTLQGTREFLARTIPWSEDGSTFCNIHWIAPRRDGKGTYWTGRAAHTVQDAIKAVEFALKGSDTLDVYACMSSQQEAIEQVSANGYRWYKPVRNQQNAVSLKSLFLDIDFKGGDHGYDTPDEAIAALGSFIKDTHLPAPSMVVKSGGGLHVYWCLAQALTPFEWSPLAFALAEATKQHGLKCDTQVTIDSARVLRVPGTFNHKTGTPRLVEIGMRSEGDYSVERLEKALAPYKNETAHSSLLPAKAPLQGQSDLAAGIDTERNQPVLLASLVPECGFIKNALATGGRDYTNPEWNLTTLISTFVEDGRAAAHMMGRHHPGYSLESTDELYARKEREKQEKGLGWPQCKTISATGCKACQSCPHFPEGKSPLNFGSRQPVLAGAQLSGPVAPLNSSVHLLQATPGAALGASGADLPQGYSREANGIITKVIANPDGTNGKMPICHYPMTNPWLQKGPWALNFTTVTDHSQQVTILTEIIGTNEMRKVLQGQGLMLHDGAARMVTEFFVSWIEKLKETKNAVVSTSPFGWNVHNGKLEGFVFGNHVWTPTGARVSPNPDPVLSRQYSPSGDVAPWTEAAKMIIEQGRPALNAIIAASFGAPLVRFTNQSGLLMSAYSQESGIGKSTALKVAQAVWGDPIRAVQSLSDTSNSVLNKIGEIKSLPLYWDELKTEDDTRRFVDLTFRLSLGKEKSRLKSDASQREPGTWQTLLVSASNESLLDFVTNRTRMTTAGLYRVFEYTVEPGKHGQIAPSDASRIVGRLNENFGKVGLQYAMFLGANFVRVEDEVAKFHRELDVEVGATPDERFWTALVAVVCMGARYARELGFCEIPEDELKAFMLDTLAGMRGQRIKQPVDMKNAMNVSNVLAQFLNANRRNTLFTNRIWISRGKPPKGAIKPERDTIHLNSSPIFVHIGMEDKIMRISSTALSEWLSENGYSRHMFTAALEREFQMKSVNGRMGSGTDFARFNEYILEIDLAGSQHANFIDEA